MNGSGSVLTVLNVNDDDANRYVVSRMLRLGGYEVLEAENGMEGLRMVRSMRPDVVVLDVHLPDISGLEVCSRIKQDPELSATCVLQLSAISIRSADKVSGLESGADGYLAMPVEPAELLATVRALVRVRHAEDESRRAATRWRRTFEAISEGVALLDEEGAVVQMNDAMSRLVGKKSSERGPYRAIFGTTLDTSDASLDELFTSPERQVREASVSGRWLRLVSDPIRERDGSIEGRVLTVADLTERRALEDDLRQHVAMLADSDRRKDEFLAMLGHELRNPLSAISSALYNLNEPDGRTDREWLREVVARQVGQLSRLVDDLLDVSRITMGKVQLRLEPIDLRRTIEHVRHSTQAAAGAKRHDLEVTVPDEPIVVHGDPNRIEQVISNLVNNAIRYTEPGGKIRLSASGDDRDVVVRVSDTGVGIAPDLLPHVFDLFTQGKQSLDRPTGGLGIGLTVVRTLVQLHGGSVQVSSRGGGTGSEFTVRFPRLFGEAPEDDKHRTLAVERPSAEVGLDIVLAEDNDDVRDLMKLMLERRGHQVRAVANGRDAIEEVRNRPPDVALVDLGLPIVDGFEVARRIRKEGAPIRLIAISGYGREEDRTQSRSAGFEAHLVKPVSPAELFESLRRV